MVIMMMMISRMIVSHLVIPYDEPWIDRLVWIHHMQLKWRSEQMMTIMMVLMQELEQHEMIEGYSWCNV
jgi:hypothetical protein